MRGDKANRPVVLVVGCGGLCYHGLPMMGVRLRGHRVVFVDFDMVEARNAARQWPGYEERSKCGSAKQVGWAVGLQADDVCWRVTDAGSVVELVNHVERRFLVPVVGMVVLPDNDACRVATLSGLVNLEAADGRGRWWVTAGNGLVEGQAWGVGRVDGKMVSEFYERHAEWWEAAAKEVREHGYSCGGHVEQSVWGNQLTMACAGRVLSEVSGGGAWWVEWNWAEVKEGVVRVWCEWPKVTSGK
jgi:hypothetical protein